MQQVDDPAFLSVGTEVSAKYKGAFCEAKVRKVVRNIKCKVAYKQGLGSGTVSDDLIKGPLRVGAVVEVKHPEKRDYVEATITKIQDCSQYTVVFDDGDITTLRRTALCLKSGRHFNESETLDQLPLTHPEHFGNPVIGGRRGRRSRHLQDDSSDDDDDHDSKEVVNEKEEHIGKVVCVESTETKKKDKDKWFPGLVVSPTAQVTVRIRVKDEYLVRSFKDGRYYTVPKKEAMEFTRELAAKQEGPAVQAALQYLDHDTLPTHWDRDALFGLANSSSEYEGEFDSDSSDDEPREEKDHFVAQLYKFMDDRGTPINKGPTITNRDVDLYRLFRAVQKLGGYNRVTGQNHWKAITLRLGFSPATVSVTNLVKQAYKKFLQPFEEFDRKLGCSMTMTPRTNRSKGRSLVRANSVASPKPEVKEPKVVPVVAEESENTSESSTDASKSKRKLSTGSGKVKILIEKYEEKVKDEAEPPSKPAKAVKEEQPPPQQPTTSTPSTSKKEKHPKKQSQAEDKRGRKKKDTETTEKTADKTETPPSAAEFPVEVGDKLKVYYHEKKVTYEAKVIEISVQQGTPLYLVHYTGWNTRYDEWVPRERIAENLSTNKTKRSKGNSSAPKPSPSNVPPNEGTKGTPISDKSTSGPSSTSTPSSAAKIVASKRGRGRSDSQPPRSSTPSSVTSSVSRTKSPAAPTPQRRTTRGQPSSSRRTSNNVSDISLQTDSDTDSDEPVKKPVRVPSTTAAPAASQAQSISTVAKITKPVTSNSQSETEEEEISVGAKGRDYDLNQIRSELKGFKELKSPSPESEPPPAIPPEKKPSVFEFSIIDENDSKPVIQSSVKPATPESKTSSTDLSSETDSFGDDDSQSSDKTTTLENMTEKFRRKIKAEKLAQAKCLERMGTNKGSEKILPIKSSSIEKIIKDSLAEKYQETLKTKPFIAESSSFCALEKEEKIKIPVEPSKCQLKLITPERKPAQPTVQIEKKLIPAVEIKASIVRPEKLVDKVQVVLKPLQKEAPTPEVTILKPATIIPEKLVKEIAKPLSQIKPSTADIYEFKEPEPFEFEARKTPVVSLASLEIEKKQKKLPPKPPEIVPEVAPKPTPPPPVAVVAKKNKKSPVKEPEKVKQIKIEEKEKPPTPESTSPINVLLSPTKIDATFDALRKSPSFNLSLSTLSDDSSSTSDTIKGTSTSTDKAETSNTAPSPPPIQSAPLPKIVPFISPFMETPKGDSANVFDLKADVENIDSDTDGDSLLGSKSGLETVKKILLADPDFDLEPPKIEKPSIADKVLKALSQQKQEEAQMKQEPPKAQVIEAPQITSFPITEPPKIELPAVIKKEIEIPLKKPILSSPEHKLDILESIAPKNNDLSETIQKLESAIQKTSTVDHYDEDSSDSTDSERRLVIEDDSQSSETNTAENLNDFPVPSKKNENSTEKEVKEEPESKEQPNFFTNKFPPSIFGIQASNFSCGSLLTDPDVKPIVDLLPFKAETEQSIKSEAAEKNEAANSLLLVKKEESLLNQDNSNIHSESINLLLCEETIPGSPTPMKECSDIKPNLHPTESDIKPVPMDIESGSMTTTVDIIPQQMPKSDNNTPNSSPRDSLSLDDSSEDLKKHHEHDNDVSPKKRRRTRKHSEAESVTKRRRAAAGVSKRNNGSDSDDNSDHNGNRTSVRSSKPCQYNFLVQLDPAMSSNQRIAILKKKIQDLRKTYNMIKAELASIDRRRKKLRRREREKKNQQKLAS